MALATILAGLAAFLWLQQRAPRHALAPLIPYTVTRSFPHATDAYCQGLVWHDGFLYEGTGNYGSSALRKVEIATGRVLQEHRLEDRYFGEGVTIWKDRIIQLTWKRRVAFVYDLKTFQPLRQFSYRGQGWGLTHDGHHLIMSDGTATLRFLDPETFEVQRQLTVTDGNSLVTELNELEYVEGNIYANVWMSDRIARISPTTGQVLGWLDLSQLYPRSQRPHHDAVLNGIAYDPQQRRLLVTGKNWPRIFELELGQ
jgi:glutamine cyclotransferase